MWGGVVEGVRVCVCKGMNIIYVGTHSIETGAAKITVVRGRSSKQQEGTLLAVLQAS